jgi:integrase
MGGRGMSVRLRYVQVVKDRHGVMRYYFRRPGAPRAALPGQPGSPEFMSAYHDALAFEVGPVASFPAHGEGTIGHLIKSYFQSVAFKATKASSQAVTRNILERFAKAHGHRKLAEMRRKHVETILSGMSETPAAANNLLIRIRIIIKYAISHELLNVDPTKGIPFYRTGTHHTWTDAELLQFEQHWPIGSRPRTAYALALFTGQRLSDVAKMTWHDYDAKADTITVKQQKTGKELTLPVHGHLRAALAAWPQHHVVIMAAKDGRGTSVHGLGNTMAEAIERAGLPKRCVFHGLRKAAARRLAEAGCTVHQIMAITGHVTLEEVQRYTAAASQAPMAKEAISMLPAVNSGSGKSKTPKLRRKIKGEKPT